jgi:formate hydrogenlyase subunit 3/multisubunit Na+/H+ antiporter MnhD subunit
MTRERTGSNARRRGLALFVLLVSVVAAGFVFLIGFFSDWSGRHEVPIQTNVGAIAILAVGIILAGAILRRGNR